MILVTRSSDAANSDSAQTPSMSVMGMFHQVAAPKKLRMVQGLASLLFCVVQFPLPCLVPFRLFRQLALQSVLCGGRVVVRVVAPANWALFNIVVLSNLAVFTVHAFPLPKSLGCLFKQSLALREGDVVQIPRTAFKSASHHPEVCRDLAQLWFHLPAPWALSAIFRCTAAPIYTLRVFEWLVARACGQCCRTGL